MFGRHSPIQSLTRRELLSRGANGFGALAMWSMLAEQSRADAPRRTDPLAPREPHHKPRAKSVIFLYMDGGPSQMDTFDPKPRLDREHGQPIQLEKIPTTQFQNVGKVLKSPWKFGQYGESGLWISDLFPELRPHADKLCVIRSMTSEFSEHTNANYFLHTGHGLAGRPSVGAWVTYGLGSESAELPGFVVINTGLIPPGGLDCFSNGFLSANYQGSVFKPGGQPIANLSPPERRPDFSRAKRDLLSSLDAAARAHQPESDAIESAIANYELAFRMQQSVPEVAALENISPAVRKIYGLDEKKTQQFGQGCLLAKRLVERGVRFVEVTCPHVGHDRWDQHANLEKGHNDNALATDKPVAGLLTDLAASGMLDETLVVWAGEFGRTPMAQGSNGRDHNPFGFTVWMAGGGVRGGLTYGATDDYGYYAIENKLEMFDLHATILHLLGLDHEQTTFRISGRDMRLTDVHGHVVKDILA